MYFKKLEVREIDTHRMHLKKIHKLHRKLMVLFKIKTCMQGMWNESDFLISKIYTLEEAHILQCTKCTLQWKICLFYKTFECTIFTQK